MKRIAILLSLAVLFGCNSNPNRELGRYKMDQEYLVASTLWYQYSPEAKALYYQGFNIAKERVLEYNRVPGDKPKAVVVDIDETMVDNSLYQGHMIETGIGFTPETWKAWTDSAMAKALPGAVEFTHFCDSLGVEVLYLSNRTVHEMEATMKNMQALDFAFIRPQNMFFKDSISGKEPRRRMVSQQYEIVLLLGDNLSDFAEIFENRGDDWGESLVEQQKEKFGKRFIIFPNPMYGDWEKNVYDKQKQLTNQQKFEKRREKSAEFLEPSPWILG